MRLKADYFLVELSRSLKLRLTKENCSQTSFNFRILRINLKDFLPISFCLFKVANVEIILALLNLFSDYLCFIKIFRLNNFCEPSWLQKHEQSSQLPSLNNKLFNKISR